MVYRRNVSRRRTTKKARASSSRRRLSSRRVSSRSRSYRMTRSRISREELKTLDYYFGYDHDSFAGGTADNFGNVDWCTTGDALFGVPQGAGPHERIGNVIKSRYINMNMTFTSAATASAANDAEVDPRRMNSQWVGTAPDQAVLLNGTTTADTLGVVKGVLSFSGLKTTYPTKYQYWLYLASLDGNDGINEGDITDESDRWAYRRTSSREPLQGTSIVSLEGAVKGSQVVYNRVNTANYNKFVRTIHRVIMFTDRRQTDGQEVVPASSLLEPYKANFAPTPCVISQLNSNNFGRYTLLYDQTFTTDSDDPVKSVSLRGFKTPLIQRYYGPTGNANSTGTIYFMYACRVSGLYTSSHPSDYSPGQLSVSGRHAYTE